ncbi:hypothetical protein GCM10029992_66930 [Glycomyces albus]
MLVSPVTDQFVVRGRDEIVDLLRDVFEVLTAIRYVRNERVASGAVLLAEARVDGLVMNEAQFVDFDEQGRIATVTLFMRPLPASTRFLRRLGPLVARRQGKPGVARTLTLAGRSSTPSRAPATESSSRWPRRRARAAADPSGNAGSTR